MFKQCFIILGFKDAHFSNCSTFQEETCLPQRVLFSQYGSLSWKIPRYYSEKWCAILKNIFYMIASTMCTWVKTHTITNIVTRALHAQEGSFDIEVDMAYSNRMLYLLKKCTCWREHSLQRDASLLQRNHLKCLNMCWL